VNPIESLGYSCRKREVRKRYGFSIAVKVVGEFIPSDEVSRAFYDIGGITYRANPTIPKNEASQEQKTAPKKSQPNQKKDNLFLLFQRSILFAWEFFRDRRVGRILLGIRFWREGLEGVFGPERRGEKGEEGNNRSTNYLS